jgi:putative alpha-1,2-mannosidase
MSAWYVFSSIGLYPYNPASATYQIGSPIFDEVSIQVSEREFFTITADNVSEKNMYIQSATLNGKPYNSTLLSHSQILQGGKLHFIMGPVPNKSWGVKQ